MVSTTFMVSIRLIKYIEKNKTYSKIQVVIKDNSVKTLKLLKILDYKKT